MKRLSIYVIGFLIATYSCDLEQNSSPQDSIEIEEFKFPLIIQENPETMERVTEYWINSGDHDPLYFFFEADSIDLNKPNWTDIESHKYSAEELTTDSNLNFVPLEAGEFKIIVDTTQIISRQGMSSYPVVIENISQTKVQIGVGFFISILAEAKNENGTWIPIEEEFRYHCGTGLESIILDSCESVLTTQYIYSGPFRTLIRLKLGNNYSNEFYGNIYKTQFESRWNENGSPKTLPNSK